MSQGGMSIIRKGHLVLHIDRQSLGITYTGNMGSSMSNVNGELQKLGLFAIDAFRQLPSFSEEGAPNYLYSATVNLEDLSESMRNRIDSLLQKVSTTSTMPENDSSIDLSDVGKARILPERYGDIV